MKLEPNFNLAESYPVLKTILSRRDIRLFQEKEVSKEIIEKILYAATWAPNHKFTEPWKFVVILPSKKAEFIDVYCQGILNMGDTPEEKAQYANKAQKLRDDFQKVPAFIAAGMKMSDNAQTLLEDSLTMGCALQNMLLAAEELGLGAHWGSGAPSRSPELLKYLNFGPDVLSLGLFQLGYPQLKGTGKRTALAEFVDWRA